ncbi:MAG: glutaminyl-peptide cyclotransferase [Archaeoglobaceae archaeon]|nr:glutaminyl-peptide cyclotransferase [Archaeoglobaceae archaeon]MDW8117748.1 glutaminyl-peptide cyclotransferase [Archaeoglobaceae archaeon]
MRKFLVLISLLALSALLILPILQQSETPRVYTYRIVKIYPHDPNAFTQGLVFEDGHLYESTGLYGCSTLRKVDLETGKVLQLLELPLNCFGEGIAIVGDKIYQLTWKERVVFVYDKHNFEVLKEISHREPTEGWGLTFDGENLIMSDGSANLYFIDPETFKIIRKIEVHEHKPIERLNELEFVEGLIYANVWMEDRIAIIEPENGKVVAWIDLSGIYKDRKDINDVLNGIAYDSENKRLFVTGKRWSKLFEIEVYLPGQK